MYKRLLLFSCWCAYAAASACAMNDSMIQRMSNFTPNLDVMVSAIRSATQLRDDDEVASMASFGWSLLESEFIPRSPFFVCTTGGRPGVENLLNQVQEDRVIPLLNDGTRTCFYLHETRDHVLDLTTSVSTLEFAMPLPGVLKIAQGFPHRIDSNAFIEDESASTGGIRVTLFPGISPDDTLACRDAIRLDLSTGTYLQRLATHFYSSGTDWQKHLAVASTCSLDGLQVSLELPYLTVRGLRSIRGNHTSCLFALLAYLTTLQEVMYVSPYPVETSTLWQASGSVQSGILSQTPLWSAGLTGKGQVASVSDGGLDINNCYFRDNNSGGRNDTSVFSPASIGAFNNKRRKVIQYVKYSDDQEDSAGHGTYVCGVIAGRVVL